MELYICPECGNVILSASSGKDISCHGHVLSLAEANVTDGSAEKHLPFCKVSNNTIDVVVGEVVHPMEEEHYIEWVLFVSDNETIFKRFNPGEKPSASFPYVKNSVVYSFCNKHGLWKTVII